jgi:hypothetical protein
METTHDGMYIGLQKYHKITKLGSMTHHQ